MKSIVCEVSVIFTDVAKIIFLMQKATLYYLEIARFRRITFSFRHVTFTFWTMH